MGNGENKEISMSDSGVSISGFSNNTLGQKTITVNYGGKTATFNVEIIKAALAGIEISNEPTYTTYIEGQNFNSEGMKVIAKYDNGTSKEITNYEVIDGNNLTVGKTSVTISYTKEDVTKIDTQGITVNKLQGSISNIQDLSKTYDGQKVSNPTYTKVGDGTVSFTWYKIQEQNERILRKSRR